MTEATDNSFFRIDLQEDIARVRVQRDRITDEDNIEQFGQRLIDLVETEGVQRLLVDAGRLEYVTSSVLGKLIFVHRRLGRDGGQMVLANVQPALMEILEATRLTTLFAISDNVDAGIARLNAT